MSEQGPIPNELTARLERLEAHDRWMKRSALVCVFVLVGAGLMAQTKKKPAAAPKPAPPAAPAQPAIVEAQGFVLKDANGQVRAELSMSGTEPTLKLRDKAGIALVTLSLNDGPSSGPIVLLSSPQRNASLTMSVLEGGGAQMTLIGERPDIQLHLGVSPDRTSLEVSDKDGFGTTIGDATYIAKNGKAKNSSAASVVLFDKERKTLWAVP